MPLGIHGCVQDSENVNSRGLLSKNDVVPVVSARSPGGDIAEGWKISESLPGQVPLCCLTCLEDEELGVRLSLFVSMLVKCVLGHRSQVRACILALRDYAL